MVLRSFAGRVDSVGTNSVKNDHLHARRDSMSTLVDAPHAKRKYDRGFGGREGEWRPLDPSSC